MAASRLLSVLCIVLVLVLSFFIADSQASIHRHYDHFTRSNKYVEGVQDAMEYFTEFGYIDPTAVKNATETMSMEDMRDVIMDFQQVCSLNQTGRLDEPTMKLINTPRCGNKDVVVHHHRHGQPSSGSGVYRPERYVLFGTKWETTELTYKITQYSRQAISPALIDAQFRRAFQIWENEINLIFIESRADKVDIEIKFSTRAHGDNFPFEGTYTLAHAFYPGSGLGGDVHMNDEVEWVSEPAALLYTAVHEIGHSLGLRHSTIQGSVMFAHYMFSGSEVTLHSDDIAGAQELYGSKPMRREPASRASTTRTTTKVPVLFDHPRWPSPPRTIPTTTTTPLTQRPFRRRPLNPEWPRRPPIPTPTLATATPRPQPSTPTPALTSRPRTYVTVTTTTSTRPSTEVNVHVFQPTNKAEEIFWERRNSELCQNGIVDAVVDLHNGTVLVFRRDFVLPLNIVNGKLIAGQIRSIQDVFKGLLPMDIDAAFTHAANGKSYYFKGNEYWRASGTFIDGGYPKRISEHFPGIPNKVDAAFEWSNNQMYFFKGVEYWRFNTKTKPQVAPNYPSKIGANNWEGIPTYNIDAAFRLVGDVREKNDRAAAPGHSYFFRSGRYWRFDDRTGKVPVDAQPPYPRDARVWFFGCTDLSMELFAL